MTILSRFSRAFVYGVVCGILKNWFDRMILLGETHAPFLEFCLRQIRDFQRFISFSRSWVQLQLFFLLAWNFFTFFYSYCMATFKLIELHLSMWRERWNFASSKTWRTILMISLPHTPKWHLSIVTHSKSPSYRFCQRPGWKISLDGGHSAAQ